MENTSTIFATKPSEGEAWDVVIIGSGPAGLTAAIYTTRGAASTLIIGGAEWGGQLMLTTHVDNFPTQPGIMGPDLMKKFREHATQFGAEFLDKKVDSVDFSKKPFELKVEDKIYKAKSVIISIGADTKWLGIAGEEKLRGRGVSSCAPCDAPFFKDKIVAVVGGGDSAMEEASVLTKYAKEVTLIHRRDEFKASAAMQKRVLENEKINILHCTEVLEVNGEDKVEGINVKSWKGSKFIKELRGEIENKYSSKIDKEDDEFVYWKIDLDGLFVAIGHAPATGLFKEEIKTDEKGYINVQDHTSTNIEGVFVAGDVHDFHYRQAITAAGFGCMAAMDALKYLDKPTPNW